MVEYVSWKVNIYATRQEVSGLYRTRRPSMMRDIEWRVKEGVKGKFVPVLN
jgi:hypothetical protein